MQGQVESTSLFFGYATFAGKITLDRGFFNDRYYVRFFVKGITELLVIGSQRKPKPKSTLLRR